MSLFKAKVGYVLTYRRVLASTGEEFSVTTNLPPNAGYIDFKEKFDKMLYAGQKRIEWVNEQELAAQRKENQDTPLNREQRRALENSAKKGN